jgi:hypothetical protein
MRRQRGPWQLPESETGTPKTIPSRFTLINDDIQNELSFYIGKVKVIKHFTSTLLKISRSVAFNFVKVIDNAGNSLLIEPHCGIAITAPNA